MTADAWRPGISLQNLADDLAAGRTTSRALTETCIARIEAVGGEGNRVFPHGVSARVLADADLQDRRRRDGQATSPFAGVPISVKDNIDLIGETTRVGSRLFQDAPPAAADSAAAALLRAAGFIILGHTNMTELAFSGLGVNPHYGTPSNPRSREVRRIPGGSSSGAAAGVGDGMAAAAIGTDTGGSCRIPAAFCGLVGFKSTSTRISREGVFPLSPTLDSVGCIGVSARCCSILDAVMAGDPDWDTAPGLAGLLRLGLLEGYPLSGLEPEVADAFFAGVSRLEAAGVLVERIEMPDLAEVARMNARGGFASAELYRLLEPRLEADGGRLDPRVLTRVMYGADLAASDYAQLAAARMSLIERTSATLDRFDAVITPTTPVLAPRFEELEADADYARLNGLLLRNPSIFNMLDRPTVSLPCQPSGALPVGLSLTGRRGGDRALLAVAVSLEALVRGAIPS